MRHTAKRFLLASYKQKPEGMAAMQVCRNVHTVEEHQIAYERIMRGCTERERRAQLSFYDMFARGIHVTAYRMLGSAEEAEDVVQEILLRTLTNTRLLVSDCWGMERRLRRMTINECIDRLRRRHISWEVLDEQSDVCDKVFFLCAMACTPLVGACRSGSTLYKEILSDETPSDGMFSKDDGMFVKEKKETFRFSKIAANATLKLSNNFGGITILRWDKDEILLERHVSISSSVAKMAVKRMESRVVRQKQVGNVYSLVLESSGVSGSVSGQENNSMNDDWTVYVPKARMSFDIHNSFGSTDLYSGIQCNDLKVVARFGPVHVPDVHVKGRCELDVEHGSLDLGKANKAGVRSKFGPVNIGQVDELDFSVGFGDMTVERVNCGEGESSFGSVAIKAVEKKLNVSSCQHGRVEITIAKGKSFEGLAVNATHTDVSIFVADMVSALYDMKTKFGSISIKTPVHSTHHQESGVNNSFLSSDSGYMGSDAKAKARIEVVTSHAGIMVRNK